MYMHEKLTFPGTAVSDEALTTRSVAVGPAVTVSVWSTRSGRSRVTWAAHPPYKRRSNILVFIIIPVLRTMLIKSKSNVRTIEIGRTLIKERIRIICTFTWKLMTKNNFNFMQNRFPFTTRLPVPVYYSEYHWFYCVIVYSQQPTFHTGCHKQRCQENKCKRLHVVWCF